MEGFFADTLEASSALPAAASSISPAASAGSQASSGTRKRKGSSPDAQGKAAKKSREHKDGDHKKKKHKQTKSVDATATTSTDALGSLPSPVPLSTATPSFVTGEPAIDPALVNEGLPTSTAETTLATEPPAAAATEAAVSDAALSHGVDPNNGLTGPTPDEQAVSEAMQAMQNIHAMSAMDMHSLSDVALPAETIAAIEMANQASALTNGEATASALAALSSANVSIEQPQGPSKKRRRQAAATTVAPGAEAESGPGLFTKRTRKTRSDQPTDEELKAKFTMDVEAMNQYLASKWIDIKELQRLEQQGVIKYKRGKFTTEERQALQDGIDQFTKNHRLTHDQVVEIMGKGRKGRNDYPKFYPELAALVPGRPVRYVKEAVKRMFDPRARKGPWTPEEDAELLKAYQMHPNEWSKISEIVDRTEMDCRDRWRGELKDKETRKKGEWTEEEVQELITAVKKVHDDLGMDYLEGDTPWQLVTKLMNGKRTVTQCRKKWQDHVLPDLRGYGDRNRAPINHQAIVDRVRALGYKNERDIVWANVVLEEWSIKLATIRATWHRLKNEIEGKDTLSLSELLTAIEDKLNKRAERKLLQVHAPRPKRTRPTDQEKAVREEAKRVEAERLLEIKDKIWAEVRGEHPDATPDVGASVVAAIAEAQAAMAAGAVGEGLVVGDAGVLDNTEKEKDRKKEKKDKKKKDKSKGKDKDLDKDSDVSNEIPALPEDSLAALTAAEAVAALSA